MRVLFDHNVPRALPRLLPGHDVSTAKREGWDELSNGRLLAADEAAAFDLLVTRDVGFAHQQSLSGRRIAVALLTAEGQDPATFERLFTALFPRLETIASGTLVLISI